MKFTYLWPLALIALVPIIVFMYLLKQKAVEHKVSSLYLWQEMYKNVEANTPWEKLKKNLLMILQIITMLILIIALMSPFITGKGLGADNAIIVIDNSASMATQYDDNQTRLEYSKKEAESYIRSCRGGTMFTLIESNDNAILDISNTDDKNEVLKKLEEIQPTMSSGNAEPGVEMIRAMKEQWPSLEAVVFTDTNVSMDGVDGYIVDTYSEMPNYSVNYVSHGYRDGELVVIGQVANNSNEDVVKDVTLYGGDEILVVSTTEIKAHSTENLYFKDIVTSSDTIKLEINGQDALPFDDSATDVLSEEGESKILLMTDANVYLEKALSQIEDVTVMKSSDIQSFDTFASSDYDLYIFDGMLPDNFPSEGNVLIFNVVYESMFDMETYLGDGAYVSAVPGVATQYIEGLEFGVGSTFAYQTPDWATPFFVSDDKTIGFWGEQDGRNIAVVGFDLHDSDLPLRMEYPLFIYNVVSQCINRGVVNEYQYEVGGSVDMTGTVEGGNLVVTKPDETAVEFSDRIGTFTDTDLLGVYKVSQLNADKGKSGKFAVNFPVSESVIENLNIEAQVDGDKVKSGVAGVLNLRNIIILVALGMLGVEWIAFLRK